MLSPNLLEGSWQLQRWEISYADGRAPSLPFGPDATGLIVYSGDGFMSACIAAAGRAPLTSASARGAPAQERVAAFDSYFHYAGRYRLEVSASGVQVVHTVTHALNPNFVGTEQVRDVTFGEAGLLTLSASDHVLGSQVARHHRLAWRRAAG